MVVNNLEKQNVKKAKLFVQLKHNKQAIQSAVKKFHQIRNQIPLIFHESINQMWTVPIRSYQTKDRKIFKNITGNTKF